MIDTDATVLLWDYFLQIPAPHLYIWGSRYTLRPLSVLVVRRQIYHNFVQLTNELNVEVFAISVYLKRSATGLLSRATPFLLLLLCYDCQIYLCAGDTVMFTSNANKSVNEGSLQCDFFPPFQKWLSEKYPKKLLNIFWLHNRYWLQACSHYYLFTTWTGDFHLIPLPLNWSCVLLQNNESIINKTIHDYTLLLLFRQRQELSYSYYLY